MWQLKEDQALQLILASASPARQAMLHAAGVVCTALASSVDEAKHKSLFAGTPTELAQHLAQAKALAVTQDHPDALVIGADQLLVCGTEIFDKPDDAAQAASHLRRLSGQTHALISAVCVVQGDTTLWMHVESATLSMRPLSEGFIARYLAAEGGEILWCVGAYKLEGRGAQLFARIEGDYFTILGLPLLPLLDFLRKAGVLEV